MHGSAIALLFVTYLTALGVAMWTDVPAQTLITWGAGGAALLWLIVLVTLPWNLHLRAREVLAEMRRSREAGIVVTDEQLAFAEKVKRWTLLTSLGTHVLSAAVALLVARFADAPLGYPFAGFYLLSCVVRPASAAMQQLRRRLETIAADTRYPRDDVLKLRAQVEAHEAAVEQHKERLRELDARNEALGAQLERQRLDLEQRMTALTRKFEESLDRLTDNRELIAGIKAFLRMIRGDSDPAAGGS
ncbi:MAG TPA: hypothetical protein VGB85_02635 [Nannocystis sp.]|jgi:hypothetical protein